MAVHITVAVLLVALSARNTFCDTGLTNALALQEICQSMLTTSVISENCRIALEEVCINPKSEWVIRMIDAAGKIPPGALFQLRSYIFGAYDECLAIKVDKCNTTERCTKNPIMGQYCGIGLVPDSTKLNLPGGSLIKLGFCSPSYCSESDLRSLIQNITIPENILEILMPKLNISMKLNVSDCVSTEKEALSDSQIGVIALFSVLGFLLLTGSLIDVLLRLAGLKTSDGKIQIRDPFGKTFCQIFISFSLFTNAQKLLNTKTGADDLSAIHGIRFLSMTWVILGHVYTGVNVPAIGNVSTVLTYAKAFFFQVIMNATVSVDSFFFLSGLLVSFYFLKEFRKRRSHYKWFLHYFHRIWRLTPAYALVIALAIIWPQFGSGPIWKQSISETAQNCKENWWTSLLYVNNLVHTDKMCLSHTWYLANDMQFYVVAPIILLLMYKFEKFGHFFNLLVLIAASVATGVIVEKHKHPPSVLIVNDIPRIMNFMADVYIKPYCRIGPYCIGLAVGHILVYHRNFKLDKGYQTLLWILSVCMSLLSLFGLYRWRNEKDWPSESVTALYSSTFRIAWTLSLAWLTLACITGRGGFINTILSWKFFVPAGRLTYMAYLLHPLLVSTTNGLTKETVMFGHYGQVISFFGHLVFSYLAAFIASLVFEAPFLGLEKVMIPREKEKKTPEMLDMEDPVLLHHELFRSSGKNGFYPDMWSPERFDDSRGRRMPLADDDFELPDYSDDKTAPRSFEPYQKRHSTIPVVNQMQIDRRMPAVSASRLNLNERRFSSVPYERDYVNNGYIPEYLRESRRF